MRPKELNYGKLKNLGNFQHERLEVKWEIEDGENIDACFAKAREWVSRKLEIKYHDDMIDEIQERFENLKKIVIDLEWNFRNENISSLKEIIESMNNQLIQTIDDLPF